MMRLLRSAPPTAIIGFVVIAVSVFASLFAPWISPFGETEIVGRVWQPVGGEFLLGTDNLGRDVLSRVIYGARNTLAIAMATTTLAFLIGASGGFLAAAAGGWLDLILGRIVDVVISIPALIFAFLILSVLGTDVFVLIISIALLESTRVYRVARAVALDVTVMDYVEFARIRGESLWYIMRREILPNVMAPLVVEFGLRFCFVFLFISTLSFLGLGLQPPTADWGSMVRENAGAISFGILIPLIPAGAIATLSVGVNLVVDWFVVLTSGLQDD